MKTYILVSVQEPERKESARYQTWLGFLSSPTIRAKRSAEIEQLAPNVFLIPKASGVTFFAHLVHELEDAGLSYRVRWMEEDDA